MKNALVKEPILQSLEHERGGVRVYETAVESAITESLRQEWMQHLREARRRVQVLEGVCRKFDLDIEETSPGRQMIRAQTESLVTAMRYARDAGDRVRAENVACECVVLAETRDFADWEALHLVARLCKHFSPLTRELVHKRVADQGGRPPLHYEPGLLNLGRENLPA